MSPSVLPLRCAQLRVALAAIPAAKPPISCRFYKSLQWTTCTRAASNASSAAPHPVVYHPDFRLSPLPEGHRFPMPKDHLLYLLLHADGLAARTFTPTPPDAATLTLAHDPAYVSALLDGTISTEAMRKIGLPWSPQLVQRTLVGTGSAVLAARLALQYGVACMTNGGTHHAHYAHGSGWCIFNDLAVAARAAQRDAGVGQVLMVDLDVHQGDGSAAIFASDESVYTFSMHCGEQSFPQQVPSNLDVSLPAGTGDAQYLQALREVLPGVLQQVKPDLVLYNAGVDVHAEDSLGKLALSDAGIYARDAFVLGQCAQLGYPVACAIGGGYAPDHAAIVRRHMWLHRAAAELMPVFAAATDRRKSAAATAARARRLASSP